MQDAEEQPGSPIGERSLEKLMEGYQRAEAADTAELVERASPALFRYFLGHTHSVAEAEDLLQDAWLRIHRARSSYRPGSPALPWFFSIAAHTRIDGYRKRARRDRWEVAMEDLPETAPPPEAPAAARIDLQALMARLPDAQREVLLLLKVSGLSVDEVARLKGATAGAVKVKAHRAYQALRAMLRGKGESK